MLLLKVEISSFSKIKKEEEETIIMGANVLKI